MGRDKARDAVACHERRLEKTQVNVRPEVGVAIRIQVGCDEGVKLVCALSGL